MTVRIDVTAEDIAAGDRNWCFRCPLGLAMSRCLRRRTGVEKTYWRFDCLNLLDIVRYPLPEAAILFVEDFDKGRPVAPFTFDVEVPS